MSTIKMAPGDTLTIGRDIRITILELQPGDRGIVVDVEVLREERAAKKSTTKPKA